MALPPSIRSRRRFPTSFTPTSEIPRLGPTRSGTVHRATSTPGGRQGAARRNHVGRDPRLAALVRQRARELDLIVVEIDRTRPLRGGGCPGGGALRTVCPRRMKRARLAEP